MSHVTTITLPDALYDELMRRKERTGEPIAAIARKALSHELRTPPVPRAARGRSRGVRPPTSVLDWLRLPPGSFPEPGGATTAPTDWDADATDSGTDAD